MDYHAGNMLLRPIGELLHGTVNDVLVCRDINSTVGTCYLLLQIRDRDTVKRLLAVFENTERALPADAEPYLYRFTENELICFVFPYREERRLSTFAAGQMASPYIRETICINLVMECLSSALPYPLLYLALDQGHIHLEKDNSVYFLPDLDLEKLDASKSESSCASACAWLLLELLEHGGSKKRNLKSYELIRKKISKRAYSGLPELYHDIKLTATPEKKTGLLARLKGAWRRSKDGLFRILLVLCILLVIIALLCLISQLLLGDIPFLRLFERAFEVIGTETLR